MLTGCFGQRCWFRLRNNLTLNTTKYFAVIYDSLDVVNTVATLHTLCIAFTPITARSSVRPASEFSDHSDKCLINNLSPLDHIFCTRPPLVYKFWTPLPPFTYRFIHGDISITAFDCCDFWATKECLLLLADNILFRKYYLNITG